MDEVVRTDFIDGVEYPPARTGFRGSHPGSYETAHAIRDGERFEIDDLPVEEMVDAVVVGADPATLADIKAELTALRRSLGAGESEP